MAKPATQPENGGLLGCATVGGVILLLALVGQCSGNDSDSNVAQIMNAANAEMGNAIAAQPPAPVEPLSKASISQGFSHLRLAVSAEGFSGAMVYSQNCYDALTRKFAWAKLDQCGGADMLAVRLIENVDTQELSSESAYLQSEAAAGRYLAAATGAGQPAADADVRLSELQAQAAKTRLLTPSSPKVQAPEVDSEAEPDDGTDPNDSLDNFVEPADSESEAPLTKPDLIG